MNDTIDRIAPYYSDLKETAASQPDYFIIRPDDREYIRQAADLLQHFKNSMIDLRYPDGWLMVSHEDRYMPDHVLAYLVSYLEHHIPYLKNGLVLPDMENGPGIRMKDPEEIVDVFGMTIEHMTRGDMFGYALFASMCCSGSIGVTPRLAKAKWGFFNRPKNESVTGRTFKLMTDLIFRRHHDKASHSMRDNLLMQFPTPDIPILDEPRMVPEPREQVVFGDRGELQWSRDWMERLRPVDQVIRRSESAVVQRLAEQKRSGGLLLRPVRRPLVRDVPRWSNFSDYISSKENDNA